MKTLIVVVNIILLTTCELAQAHEPDSYQTYRSELNYREKVIQQQQEQTRAIEEQTEAIERAAREAQRQADDAAFDRSMQIIWDELD